MAVEGLPFQFSGSVLHVSEIHDLHNAQPNNFDPMGVELDRKGSGQLMYYNLAPRPIQRGPDYLVEGVDNEGTGGTGKRSDGRAAVYTDARCPNVTLELTCVVQDLSDVDIAIPDFSNTGLDPVSEDGVWYIGPRSDATLCGPLMCVATDENGVLSLGLAVELRSDVVGINPVGGESTGTSGLFTLSKLNGGGSDAEEIIATAPAPSPRPTAGDLVVFVCAVTGDKLNVWANNVLIFSDVSIPAEMIGTTKHGVFGRWPDADIDFDLGFAHAPVKITCPEFVALPRISVSGTDLIRYGHPFKVFGLQLSALEWTRDYFRTGGPTERRECTLYTRGARKYGANVLRIHLELWDFIEGDSAAGLSIIHNAVSNLLYAIEAARQHQIYVLLSGNNSWYIEDVPAWYDALTHPERWEVQAFFWREIADAIARSGNSTTLLAYELMSEPFVSTDPDADWYVGAIEGAYFGQNIAVGITVGNRNQVARDWITLLKAAIKDNDPGALVTIGLLPFSNSAFIPTNIDDLLDFVSPHLYPPSGILPTTVTLEDAIDDILYWDASTKPIVVGETFAWADPVEDNYTFYDVMMPLVEGIITMYYGYEPEKYTEPPFAQRPPANTSPEWYVLWRDSMVLLRTYRNDFLADNY